MSVGCATATAGCRPGDRIDPAYIAQSGTPPRFTADGKDRPSRPYKTTENTVTAWWDASQIYGYDETSRRRVKRAPDDPAKLLLSPAGQRAGAGERQGYLPLLEASDPMNPQWAGQEAVGFPDNWTIGMSFYHTVFAREHNLFVDAFRAQAAATPDADSGLRNPARPDQVIRYRDVTADELFEAARLVVAAEIAKIHTTEWTPQLLYDEPLFLGMNANWSGLFRGKEIVQAALEKITVNSFGKSTDVKKATQWYSVFASGPGIFGLGNRVYADDAIFAAYDPSKTDLWSIKNPDDVNGGINHFGSPFNFPEEFVTVYRLHPLVPDLIDYRQWDAEPNRIQNKVAGGRDPARPRDPGDARAAAWRTGRSRWGGSGWALLTLANHPQFLQNLEIPRLGSPTRQDRRGRARPDPRPRARRAALQRVPPPVRAAPAHQLRRLRRHQAAQGLAGARRAGAADRRSARDLRAAPLRRLQDHHRGAGERRRHARSTTAWASPTAPWSTTWRTSTRWSAGWRSSPGRTASPSPRRSSRCSS